MNSLRFKQGDIAIGSFPYSDFTRHVRRPILVASSDQYNNYSDDLIAVKVTSQLKQRPFAVSLGNDDLETGALKKPSSIKVDSVFFVSQKLLSGPVANVKEKVLDSVKGQLKSLFSLG